MDAATASREPGELLAYRHATHGRALPAAVKRGVADAVSRLYTPCAALKWDSARNAIRLLDVVELVHPRSREAAQSELDRYLLDVRHNPDTARADPGLLPMVAARRGPGGAHRGPP